MTHPVEYNPGSFRDPCGFIFKRNGRLFRQINKIYEENYRLLIDSGLYRKLTDEGLLISHEEVADDSGVTDQAFKVIQPEPVEFISYPYEFCFSQLKDAALTTLAIQETALNHGMILKDASAYNIQFHHGKPVFIDTLSFDKYTDGQIWIAYRQFCQHFLAPLALMSHVDTRIGHLQQIYIDGLPLDLTSRLLPAKTKLSFSLLTHIHLHARSQKRYSGKQLKVPSHNRKMTLRALLGLIDSLKSAVTNLRWKMTSTEWGDYYDNTNYSRTSFEQKKKLVEMFITKASPGTVFDIGANMGEFSRVASDMGISTVSFDIDPVAVEKNYRLVRSRNEKHILPLVLDLTNPTPGRGWQNTERSSFIDRGPADTVMALALIHHLAISNNLPFEKIAGFLSGIVKEFLIIEFVPKEDSQVQRLLTSREDIFDRYDKEMFEKTFSNYFNIVESSAVSGSERTLYLMKKNDR